MPWRYPLLSKAPADDAGGRHHLQPTTQGRIIFSGQSGSNRLNAILRPRVAADDGGVCAEKILRRLKNVVTASRIEREFANLRRRVARLAYSPFGKAVISFRRNLQFKLLTLFPPRIRPKVYSRCLAGLQRRSCACR